MDFDSFDAVRMLFSSDTIHWVTVNFNDAEWRLKYKPLSLYEKINIHNKYLGLPEDDYNRKSSLEQCRTMLYKANEDEPEMEVDDLPPVALGIIYKSIMEDLHAKKDSLNKFYEANHTVPIKPSKSHPNKLDSLVNLTLLCKETNHTLSDICSMDELSLDSLLKGISEMSVRESNTYESSKGGK